MISLLLFSCDINPESENQLVNSSGQEFFSSRTFDSSAIMCDNTISFTIGTEVVDEDFFGSNLFSSLNAIYEEHPMEVLCACDCNSAEIIQDFLNANITTYGYLEDSPVYELTCDEIYQSLAIQCNNNTEFIRDELNGRIDEMLDNSLLTPDFVNNILYPMLDDLQSNPTNFDFCPYKEEFIVMEPDLDVLQRISSAQSLMIAENIRNYYSDQPNDVDDPVQLWRHVLGGLWGGYTGALTWVITSEPGGLYGEAGQDCLGTNAGYGALFGAIGGF